LKDVVRPAAGAAPTPLGTYWRLLTYLKPYRLGFAAGLIGAVLYALAMISFPEAGKRFIDVLSHPDPGTILWLPVAVVLIFVVRGLGDFVQTYFMGYVGRGVVKRLRDEILQRTLRLPVSYFDRSSSGTMLSQLTFNTEQIGQAITDAVTSIVRSSLTIIGYVIVLLHTNVRLTLLSLTMGPVVAVLVSVINRYFRRYGRRIQDSMGDVTRVAKEGFEAPRLIKVYNAEAHVTARFEAMNERNRRSNMRLILTKGLSNPVVQVLTAIGAAFILAFSLSEVMHGRIGAGDLVAFFIALGSMTQPLKELVSAFGPIQQGIAAGESIFATLDTSTEIQGGGYSAQRVKGEVRFEEVSFTYDTGKGPALRGITLAVPAGQSMAIVGRSGSGKSTLVNLLPRFYDVKTGLVRVDGHDVRDFNLHNLREQIAVVSQDVVLFDDTIRNNIAFGRKVSDAQIEAAAEAAHAMEFIRNQPQGLDTMVGDRGVLLSGGQRQRIAIARALLKNAPILILDEATSALDTEAERHIQAALTRLMRDRTTFIIAHRLSTVEQADRIIVLDAGAIVESGTHTELIERGGVYAQLYKLNFNE
jgi:subfamily B ATP-binding cassette protein MsbA